MTTTSRSVRNVDWARVQTYLVAETSFPNTVRSIRRHLSTYPGCTCELWMPHAGGVSTLSDLAPSCNVCGIDTYWGSGRWEQAYDDDPATLALFAYLKHVFPREDDPDPDDYWAYVCNCCWDRYIIHPETLDQLEDTSS